MKLKLHAKIKVFFILTFFMFLLGGILSINAQTTYYARNSGTWVPGIATASIFSLSSCSTSLSSRNPTSEDRIIICDGVTLTVGGSGNIATVLIGNGSTLTVNNTFTLTATTGIAIFPVASTNVIGTISGGGSINTAILQAGGSEAPKYEKHVSAAESTLRLTSTISTMAVSDFLYVMSSQGSSGGSGGAQLHNSTFTQRSGVLSVNGSVKTINGVAANTSTLILGNSNPTLNLGGSIPFDINGTGTSTITLNGTGSTVNYSFIGAQTVRSTSYNNLTLSGSGVKTIAGVTVAGDLLITNAATVAPSSTVSVFGTTTLSNTSVLTLGSDNILSSNPLVLNGGTFKTGATTGFNQTLGTLGLTSASTIELGNGGHSLKFAPSNGLSWTGSALTITGWTGAAGGRLFVGTTSSGLTAAQLSKIHFEGYGVGGKALSTGEIVPSSSYLVVVPSNLSFGSVTSGATSANQTYSLSGNNLTGFPGNIVITAPANFEISLSAGSGFAQSINAGYTSATLSNTPIYVRFKPTATSANYSGVITNSGGGSIINNVTVSGNSLVYCAANGYCDEYISRVQVGTIDNSSFCSDSYTDYSVQNTTMIVGKGYPITVTNGKFFSGDQYGIWVDWNGDGDFLDANETIASSTGGATFSSTITPPSNAISGSVRMRIRITYTGAFSSCGTTDYGEVEDYSIIVKPKIDTGVISGSPFCVGSPISVPYTISGTFNTGNVFTAQLSDASGSFAAPVSVGTLASITSGAISAIIPAATAAGSGYRIRVVSSNPLVIGADNGSSFTVNTLPGVPTATGGLICIGSTTILSASGAASGDKYKWYDAAMGGALLKTSSSNADNNYTTPVLSATKNYWVAIINSNGCENNRTQVTATYPANSPDSQTTEGQNTWLGHVYDGTNATVSSTENFTNYFGVQTEPESFDESFGGNANCFNITSSLGSRSIYSETFSIRYRMKSSRKGLYVVDLGSDDGTRLAIDGTLIYNNWSDQGFTTKSRVLISLTGTSSLQYDFYENTGGNRVVFNNLLQVLSNTLTLNTSQNVCLGTSGVAISGDSYGTLPTGISLSGTGYQWASSTTSNGPWTDISGASAATFTPSTSTAPFNTPGTYYLIRKAILSSANNVAPNPFILTNESNVSIVTVNSLPNISQVPANAILNYKFNGNANDAGGTNNGSLQNSPASSVDRFNNVDNAYSFNGSNQYVSSSTSYNNPTNFTISIWFKTSTSTGGKLIGFGNSKLGTSAQYDRHLYMNDAGQIYFGVYPGSVVTINSPLAYNDNAWHLATATLSSTSGMVLYIDGIEVSTNANKDTQNYSGFWKIGYDNNSGWTSQPSSYYFNGLLDDVLVYHTALSATEVETLYSSPDGAGSNGPVCPGSTLNLKATTVSGATYSWSGPNGFSSSQQNPSFLYSAANQGVYAVQVSTGGCTSTAYTRVSTASCINKWKGTLSTDWNIPGNWTQNFVPAVDASIVFDDAPVNHLVLDQNRSVTNILNAQSTYRMVCNGHQLTLKGNMMFTNGAQIDASANNSRIEFAGNSTQAITSGSFFNDQVFNLTVNNSNNVTVNGNLRILNLLSVSSGRLDALSNSPTIIYGGSSAQTIESGQYMNEKIFNLNINNAAGVSLNTNFILDNKLTINAGKLFTIEANKNLTVTGAIANSASTSGLVLKSTAAGTASLIHNTDNVPATVQRYISGAKEAWHFLSTPVSDQAIAGSSLTPSGTYGNGTGYDLYLWNEPTPCWVYHKNDEGGLPVDPKNPKWPAVHSSTNFIPGRGYLYSVQATNPTTEFAGNLNNGSITYSITNSINGEDPKVRGFNLIGNPYPSAIDWKAASGWTRTDLVPSSGGYDMWIWNPAISNYGVFNSETAVGTNGVTQNIAPMQGFFVRAATSGTVSMTNSIRGNSGASNWMRMKTSKVEMIKVQIASNENNGSDEILLQFGAPYNEAGAAKLFSTVTTAPSLFLNHEKKELSVLNLTDIIENSSVSLMFKAGKDGNYTLSIGNESASYNELYLEDKRTKTITDLNVIPTYQFKGSVKDAADRFVLHFKPIIPEVVNLPAVIYYDGNEINVDLTLVEGQTDIKVYDMLGKLLVDKKVEGKMIHRFAISVKNEVYIVLASSKGKSISRKVLVY